MRQAFSQLLSGSSRATDWMAGQIAHVCRTFGPRSPGSPGERAAAEHMAALLEREGGCPAALVESFREHPAAFYGYFRFSMALDVLTCAGFFLRPWLSLVFGSLALGLFVFKFLLYWPVIDGLFPAREGTNVTAVRPCRGTVERRVFVNGHVDAAWEFPLNYRFGGVVFEIPGVMAVIGVLFYMVLAVGSLRNGGEALRRAALWGIGFVPFFVLVGGTYDPRRIVDGANDDLTGCAMGLALLRSMEEAGITLDHTEVGVILTGSEEAGLRGAKAWCRAHAGAGGDAPTFILTFDTIHDPRYLMVNARDLNGTVKADPALGELFLRAAREVGVPCRKGWVPPMGGATDSAAFVRGGFRAVGITGLNHRLERYYHTRRDSWDNLDLSGMENAYRALVRAVELIDGGALDGSGPKSR